MGDRQAEGEGSAVDVSALLSEIDALSVERLWPSALEVDRGDRIPDQHWQALSELGLFAMVVPADLGGLGLPGPTIRRVLRSLGAGCGATAFAFAQHGGVAGALARTGNRELRRSWLPRLVAGELAGTAFAHVRRVGSSPVRATRIDGGWRLDGEAPWATSWGTAVVFSVAAVADSGDLVWVLVPGRPSPTIVPSAPMALVAFEATQTVSLRFDAHVVPDGDVLEVTDLARWRLEDRRGAARPNPLCLGVGDRALLELGRAAPETAAAVADWWSALGARAESAARAADDPSADVAAIAAVRTESVLAAQSIANALMAATGGRAAGRDNPAQLLARQALFYVVQAQNDDGRAATLAAVAALAQAGTEAPKK